MSDHKGERTRLGSDEHVCLEKYKHVQITIERERCTCEMLEFEQYGAILVN